MLNEDVGNVNVFISLVNQRVFDMFVKNWNVYINDSNRARCYNVYANLRFHPYLNLIHIEQNCVLLSCFRVSAHMLEVETDKMKKTRSSNFK